jgi:hypothetical protein
LAKPNYTFEKRQRELAKKKKQDAKQARKREAREAGAPEEAAVPEAAPAPPAPAPAAAEAQDGVRGARVHRRPATS